MHLLNNHELIQLLTNQMSLSRGVRETHQWDCVLCSPGQRCGLRRYIKEHIIIIFYLRLHRVPCYHDDATPWTAGTWNYNARWDGIIFGVWSLLIVRLPTSSVLLVIAWYNYISPCKSASWLRVNYPGF